MGLCLYLALTERLTQGFIDLIILDDVVMSVDATHRRAVCGLLTNCFPEKQFLITTHDKTWASQMRSEGLVQGKGVIEFYKWDIDTGPYINYESDMWERIESYLDKNDIPNAAFLLRKGLEGFFAYVCDVQSAKLNITWMENMV